jgi:hypothetical protein
MRKVRKAPIDPDRIRTIPPEGFSWIDRRFVREGFIKPLEKNAAFLYLFLTAVSDAEGLSFYADPTIGSLLKLTCEELTQARAELIDQGVILYRHPLYQVLPLPTAVKPRPRVDSTSPAPHRKEGPPSDEPLMSLKEFLQLKGRERATREGSDHGQKKAAPI